MFLDPQNRWHPIKINSLSQKNLEQALEKHWALFAHSHDCDLSWDNVFRQS